MDPHATRQAAVPALLWVVIAMFAIVAACLLYPTLVLLRLGAAFFSFSPALGLLGLGIALVMGSFVVAFARVGYGLYEGSRVARGIAFVLAGYLLLACFAMPVATGLTVVLALGSIGVVAALACVPSARAWFAGPWGRATELPTSIVVAQTVVLYSSAITALLAATLLVSGIAVASLVGSTASLMILGALLCAGIAGVGFWAKAAIGRGERLARVLVTGATVADLVVVLLLSSADESVLPLLASFGLHAAVVIALWLPADARRFFGEAALPAVENLHRQVLEIGKGAAPGPVPPAPTAPGPIRPTPRPTPPPTRHAAPPSAPFGWAPPPGPPPAVPTRPGLTSPPAGLPVRSGPPSGRHMRPDLTEPAVTTPAVDTPAFCARCGSGAVPGAVHCVRCGARLVGHGTSEPRS
ncbi:hypothetical protein [Actinomycetospora soli]|uniref:hypothetical protein n=1 Tax=Actinomycetospora soli TaxID=2893887 RepID=UPI001E34BD5A|nr:hypothetical protein [Actinomycetospora soli]MCD2187857.1 hypothetical protein [Actinomycetospora soli]